MERFLSYDYYNKLKGIDLFKTKIHIKELGFETTNFDMLVNLLYHENPQEGHIYGIEAHMAHEDEIKKILTKFKKEDIIEYFNSDSDRKYPYGKYYLEGKTGMMSSLLVNSQYILYNYLLSLGVIANIHDDCLIIFIKLINTNMTLIPQKELDAINNIFKKYRELRLDISIIDAFTSMYSDLSINFFKKDWYIERYGNKYNIDVIISNSNLKDFIGDYINRDHTIYKQKDPEHIFGVNWEYAPAFSNYHNNVTPKFIELIKDGLLNSNLSQQNFFFLLNSNSNNSNNLNSEKVYLKYLKYKSKYILLKKNKAIK